MPEGRDAGDDRVDARTREEEERESTAAHRADRVPTPEEEAAADRTESDPDVAAHEHEMGRLGAEVKGEGQID